MASVSLKHINKVYGTKVKAINDFNLEIEEGEFVVMVGPSGSGKSTILRMIAGLEEVTAGEIYIDGKLSNEIAPKNRSIAMVFQNYALYPHLTVYQNIAFGIKSLNLSKAEEKKQVEKVADILEIADYLGRKPAHLSGGQKQRVALARAIVREPNIFLLDEPLSNLDAFLRNQMRAEIAKLHHKLKTTFIYVTHDQLEALSMADKIVVLHEGQTMQIGSPKEIYDTPANRFVAMFLGHPPMNILPAYLSKDGQFFTLVDQSFSLSIKQQNQFFDPFYFDKNIEIGIRAHNFLIIEENSTNTQKTMRGKVISYEIMGEMVLIKVNVPGIPKPITVFAKPHNILKRNDDISLAIDTTNIHFFDSSDGRRIMGISEYSILRDINAHHDNKDLHITIGTENISLDVVDRLVHKDISLKGASLSIKTSAISLLPQVGAISLTGLVQEIIASDKTDGILVAIPQLKEKIAIRLAKDNKFAVNDPITIYIDKIGINLIDKDGSKMLASYPVSNNEIPLHMVKNTKWLTKQKMKIITEPSKVETAINLTIEATKVLLKNRLGKTQGITLKGMIYASDNLGKETVLFCKINRSNQYFTAVIDSELDMHLTPQVKFLLPYTALKNQSS